MTVLPTSWTQVRAVALFGLGAGLTLWDVTWHTPGEVNATLLLFYVSLMGLEPVLRADERRRNGKQ